MDADTIKQIQGMMSDKLNDIKVSFDHLVEIIESQMKENEELLSRVDELEASLEEGED